jgi:hypothetical protein
VSPLRSRQNNNAMVKQHSGNSHPSIEELLEVSNENIEERKAHLLSAAPFCSVTQVRDVC